MFQMLVVLLHVYTLLSAAVNCLKKLLRWVVVVFDAESTPKGHVIT